MDFSYIKSAAKCPPGCVSSGQVGPLFTGIDGRPNDAGPNISNPTPGGIPVEQTDDTGYTTPLHNPLPTGTGKDAEAARAISCVNIEVTPKEFSITPGQRVAFNFTVTYSDGNTQTDYTFGLPGANSVWLSSDDGVLKFEEPSRIGQAPNGSGFVARGVSVGDDVLVSVEYSHPGTKDDPSRPANTNWFEPCQLTGYSTGSVLSVTDSTTPDLVELQDFVQDAFPSKTIDRLEISPIAGISIDAFLGIGDVWPMRVRAVKANGNTENVSPDAMWSSSDPDIATIDEYGDVTGVAAGLATIRATFNGHIATAVVEVGTSLSGSTIHGNIYTVNPIDTVIVLDRSASMNIRDSHGLSRVERAKDAALQFVANSTEDSDTIGLVSFAGTWIKGASELVAAQTEADATLDQVLTDDRQTIRDAINRFKIEGPCAMVEWEGTRCATGIGAGLQRAKAEVDSDRHEYTHKKMVLLLTDGCENVDKPTPLSVANELKLAGTLVCVVALDSPSCATDLEALATPGLYFPSTTAYELAKNMGEVPHFVGYGEYGYSWYT